MFHLFWYFLYAGQSTTMMMMYWLNLTMLSVPSSLPSFGGLSVIADFSILACLMALANKILDFICVPRNFHILFSSESPRFLPSKIYRTHRWHLRVMGCHGAQFLTLSLKINSLGIPGYARVLMYYHIPLWDLHANSSVIAWNYNISSKISFCIWSAPHSSWDIRRVTKIPFTISKVFACDFVGTVATGL